MTEDIYIANFGGMAIDVKEEEKVVEVLLRLEGVKCTNYQWSEGSKWTLCEKPATHLVRSSRISKNSNLYLSLCNSCYETYQGSYQENRW